MPPLPPSPAAILAATPPAPIRPPAAPRDERAALDTHTLRRRVDRRTLKHLHEIRQAIAEIDHLPEPGESLHCIMRGNFQGWDLVPAILNLAAPATIKTLHVSTLGFNRRNAAELCRLIDERKIEKTVFICSNYFHTQCPDEFEILRAGLEERRQTLAAVPTHAKILAMQLTDERHIVVESSANLRSCNKIEQFAMSQCRDLYAFHVTWIEQVIAAAL